MIEPNCIPVYWRHELSGLMEAAVNAYFADNEPLTSEHLTALKHYVCSWANAPIYDMNPYQTESRKAQLEKVREKAEAIENRKDLSNCLNALHHLAIDPL